jgi:hypothetical protein
VKDRGLQRGRASGIRTAPTEFQGPLIETTTFSGNGSNPTTEFEPVAAEKREPASDIDTAVVVSLKALDPNRPIREADIIWRFGRVSD